jgi:LacI family transcriptional regulator
VFCINDIVALGVMRELRLRRMELPRDMALVGYDDVTFASELMTPLTSVRQPMHELGWTAADMLLAGADASDHRVFRPELIVRESSAG